MARQTRNMPQTIGMGLTRHCSLQPRTLDFSRTEPIRPLAASPRESMSMAATATMGGKRMTARRLPVM